jgi:hypothetical protein
MNMNGIVVLSLPANFQGKVVTILHDKANFGMYNSSCTAIYKSISNQRFFTPYAFHLRSVMFDAAPP